MTRRLAGAAFWILLALLVVANALVMWHSLTVLRLWEDEAFNLTVPRNLVAGLGYTSDGTLSGSTLTPFDPRISTGPVVLLPVAGVLMLGVDPVIGARLVPLAYWVLLLVGCAVLGRRLAGRSGALIAVALPLAFNTADSVSPIQGPADLLGEIPAAALIVWALIVLPRRGWLAGLLLGLAVQAKLIALLALPAFAVALFLLTPPAPFGRRLVATLRRSLVPLVLVATPTLLIELTALVSLGVAGYRTHLRELLGFVRSGGQAGPPTTIPQKLSLLSDSWFLPSWLVMTALLLSVIAVLWAAVPAPLHTFSGHDTTNDVALRRRWWDRDPHVLALGFGSAIGLLAFVGWWAQASQLPLWVRHPAVGVYAFAPLLAAVVVRAVQALWARRSRQARGSSRGAHAARMAARLLAVVSIATLVAVVAGGATADTVRALQPPVTQTLDQQRAAIAPGAAWVRENHVQWLAAEPWGVATSYAVLTGAHAGLSDAASMQNVPIVTGSACTTGAPLAEGPGAVICPAR